MTPERRRQLLESSRLGRSVIGGSPATFYSPDEPRDHGKWVKDTQAEPAGASEPKADAPAAATPEPLPVAKKPTAAEKKAAKAAASTAAAHRATVTEGGREFATGKPVSFPTMRNPTPAPKRKKGSEDAYQQEIEPAGRYLLHDSEGAAAAGKLAPGWHSDHITFKNPLVVPLNSDDKGGRIYDENSWKMNLSKEFGGKKGASLSNAVARKGHDGIVTVDKYGTREIVDLRHLHANPA